MIRPSIRYRFLSLAVAFFLLHSDSWGKPHSGILSTDFDGKLSGARFIGAGDSGVALSGLPESPLYNPAALHDITSPLFSIDMDVAHHSSLTESEIFNGVSLRGRKLTYLGFAAPDGAFFYRPLANFSQTTVTVSTDPANHFIQEDLKVNQFGFTVAQVSDKDQNSAVGLTISYLNAQRGYAKAVAGQPPTLKLASGNGFTADIGVLTHRKNFSFGVAAFNLPGIIYWNVYRPDQLPIKLRGGAVFHPVSQFSFSTEYEKRFYRGGLPRPGLWHLGSEFKPYSWIQLRGGTYSEDFNDINKTVYTGGLSFASNKNQRLDFALRIYRVNLKRVYNYFITLILPLPESRSESKGGADNRFWSIQEPNSGNNAK